VAHLHHNQRRSGHGCFGLAIELLVTHNKYIATYTPASAGMSMLSLWMYKRRGTGPGLELLYLPLCSLQHVCFYLQGDDIHGGEMALFRCEARFEFPAASDLYATTA